MLINQIAVFLENRQGRLSQLCNVLAQNGVNLKTMSIADTNDFGILRALTDDNDKAEKVLKDAGFTVSRADLLGVEVEDEPGCLAEVLKQLDVDGVNIEYLYSFATRKGKAVILFKVEDNAATLDILKKNGVTLFEE